MTIENNLEAVATSIDRIVDDMNPRNAFGQTIGDELHYLVYQLERIADALEKITDK